MSQWRMPSFTPASNIQIYFILYGEQCVEKSLYAIALDKRRYHVNIFLIFLLKHVVGTH